MKILLLICLLGAGDAHGSEAAAALYNEGNALYRSGNYPGAIERYEAALATDLKNSKLHYNLGNAAFKARRLGRAILAYERALKLSPNDEDVIANLELANARKVDRTETEDPNVVTRAVMAIYGAADARTLTVLASLSLFALSGLGVLALFRPDFRMVGMVAGAGIGVVGLLVVALLVTKIGDRNRPAAIVVTSQVTGRSGPGEDFLEVFTLHEGTKVGVERSEGGWFQVRLGNGIGGWLPESTLVRI